MQIEAVMTLRQARTIGYCRAEDYRLRGASWLYRLFDGDRRLLYVGVAKCVQYRFSAHVRKPWWPAVTWVSLVPFDRRHEAFAAERDAIRTEDPMHNIVGRGPREDRVRVTEPLARMVVVGSGEAPPHVRARMPEEQGAGSREVGAGMNVATAIHSQVSAHERMDGVNRCR